VHDLLAAWAAFYGNHAVLRTAVTFVHIAGLVAGGGCAITADLATLTLDHEDPRARQVHLGMLARTHGLVLSGLVAVAISGLLLLAADLDTYLHSWMFWTKMGLIVLLLVNGTVVLRGERKAAGSGPATWRQLHRAASASLVLWTLTTIAGAALPNIG
jgi:uncharacterized membrane protein